MQKKVSRRTVISWLQRLDYTIQKKFYHTKQDENQREYFSKLPRDDELVFLDESGIEDNACREYGWSPANKRERAFQYKRRISRLLDS